MLFGKNNNLFNITIGVVVVFSLIFSQNIYNLNAHTNKESEGFVNADDHCTNPTMEVTIAASSGLSFDREVIEVPTDTCVTIFFLNVVEVPHSFIIAPMDGDIKLEAVYMNLENSTAVCGQASSDKADTPGEARFNINTPSQPVDLYFFCGYPGHHEAGMDGILRVVRTLNTDDKSILIIPLALFFIAVIVVLRVLLKTIV